MHKLIISTFLFAAAMSAQAQKDAGNCEDHSLITRYPGAVITWCEAQNFGTYHIATGPQTGYKNIDEWLTVEGRIYRIYYEIKGRATMSEVFQNYRNSMERSGLKILAQGLHPGRNVKKEVGGNSWMGTAYAKNPFPTNSGVMLFHGASDSGGMGYAAGKLTRPSGNVYVILAAYQHRSDETVVLLDIVEEAPLDDGKVTVDADYIAREIEANGTVALYGIFFEFDKAVIQSQSKPDLDAIAGYLKKHPKSKLYIVGHTDMKGSLTYNLTLSEKRAQAVADALVSNYGIARERLDPKGVGPLSPRSQNRDEAGRKLNRRVELVIKL